MTDSQKSDSASAAVAPPAAATPKKGRAKAVAKPRALAAKGEKKVATASHPTSAHMVVEAITKLADRKGASFQAIKKSIADTHKVDLDKQSVHIKKALKKLVETGKLAQVTGTGAAGRFKLADKPKAVKKDVAAEKKPKAKKAASPKKTAAKKPVSKKVTAPKAKPGATKKPAAAAKKATPAAKSKTVKKAPAAKGNPATAEKKPKIATSAKPSKPAKVGKAKAAPKVRLPKPKAAVKGN